MPAHKDILNGCHTSKAGKLRCCRHNKEHKIAKGDMLLLAREGMNWNGYCLECAIQMLDRAEAELAEIRKSLGV
jgi:hypothetical protein